MKGQAHSQSNLRPHPTPGAIAPALPLRRRRSPKPDILFPPGALTGTYPLKNMGKNAFSETPGRRMPRYWFADCEEILRRHDLFSVSLYRPKQGDHLMAQDDTAQLWREGIAPDFLATANPLWNGICEGLG